MAPLPQLSDALCPHRVPLPPGRVCWDFSPLCLASPLQVTQLLCWAQPVPGLPSSEAGQTPGFSAATLAPPEPRAPGLGLPTEGHQRWDTAPVKGPKGGGC